MSGRIFDFNEEPPRPAEPLPSSGNSILTIGLLVFGFLLTLGLILSLLDRAPNRTAITAQSNNQLTPSPTVEPTTSKKQLMPEQQTFTGNKALLGLYITPCLVATLDDPGSLQDFTVLSAKPEKGEPRVFEVVVFYRARNGFGALIAKRQTWEVLTGSDRSMFDCNAIPLSD